MRENPVDGRHEVGVGETLESAMPFPFRAQDRHGTGVRALAAALALGVLGDALLRVVPGINIVLWVGVALVTVGWLARDAGVELRGEGRWLAWPILFFSAALAWRASIPLMLLTLLTLLATFALGAWRARQGRLVRAGVAEYLSGLAAGAASAGVGALFLLLGVRWQRLPSRARSGWWLPAVRGLLLALPLLLVFGWLLSSADRMFEALFRAVFSPDLSGFLPHLVWIGVLSWLTAGLLWWVIASRDWQIPAHIGPPAPTLGIIEVGTILGLLNALFLAFVLVQLRYLFGGTELVEAAGFSFAEYARRGFFELVAVTALVLPLLLGMHWLLRREPAEGQRIFRVLAVVQLVLLCAIMASALQRMRLYQMEYGLTFLRILTTVFMAWLAAVLAWFAATVLRGRRDRFAFGAMVAGFVALALLHGLNPDALIVRANAGLERRQFDVAYASSLSADAVPVLLRVLPTLAEPARCELVNHLLSRLERDSYGRSDWRSWNWSRMRARQLLRKNRAALQSIPCPPGPARAGDGLQPGMLPATAPSPETIITVQQETPEWRPKPEAVPRR